MKKQPQKFASVPAAQKIVDANEPVEFDARHVDSPLCACRDCNDAWLKRRDQPMSMKHTRHTAPPIDINTKKQIVARFKKLGVNAELKNEHNMRIAFWRLVDKATDYTTTMGFDSDVLFVLDRLEQKGLALKPGLTLQAACTDLLAPRDAGPVRSSSAGNLTGGPFCVVCDTAGGLPCPAMVANALKLGIKLAYPPGDARLGPSHVHPGRCRKRLKAWIEGGTQLATGKAGPGSGGQKT